jgi:hypothetical protein
VPSCPEPSRPSQLFRLLLTHRSSIFHTQVVYAFFLAFKDLHVVTIDPLPPSTSPSRDAVPNHRRTSHSSAQFESAVSSVSTNLPFPGRSHTTTSPVVPATRLRSELEAENRTDTIPRPPETRPCAPSVLYCFNQLINIYSNLYSSDTPSERALKRQRLEIIDPSSQFASSSRSGTSVAEHDPFPRNILSMRPPERGYDTDPTSPFVHPQTRSSSSSPPPKANGHVTNGHGSSMNGSSKRSKSPVARVELPGATIYDDSYIDREEYIRLVIQSLRDIGYMCVLHALL